METFDSIIAWLENLIWNTPDAMPAMVVILLAFGIFITVRLSFIQIRHFKHGVKVVSGNMMIRMMKGDINHFRHSALHFPQRLESVILPVWPLPFIMAGPVLFSGCG
jgi:Na+/alanine symporter